MTDADTLRTLLDGQTDLFLTVARLPDGRWQANKRVGSSTFRVRVHDDPFAAIAAALTSEEPRAATSTDELEGVFG